MTVNIQQVQVVCTVQDMISKAAFTVDDEVLIYPGYYTNEQLYQGRSNNLINVQFYMTDNAIGPFSFIPDLNGLVVTIYNRTVDYDPNKPVVLTDTPFGVKMVTEPFFVCSDTKCLHFRDIGYPYKDPLTGYIKHSLLIAAYKDI